jgi:hypothetical protein
VLGKLFGKGKQKPVVSAEPSEPAVRADPPEPAAMPAVGQPPWEGEPEQAACDFAVGNLFNTLPARLAVEGRVHAQTCLAAIGAIAGFSAQRALFEHLKTSGDQALLKQMRTVKTKSGGEYFFGEPLNRMLIPASEAESNQRLWSLAASGAVTAGLAFSKLPDLGDMFTHIATTIGGEREGLPSIGKAHYPHLAGKELLKAVWPLALACFSGQIPDAPRDYGAAPTRHWPAISGRVASALIQKMAPALDPRIALIIVMESAIHASKVKPSVANAVAA